MACSVWSANHCNHNLINPIVQFSTPHFQSVVLQLFATQKIEGKCLNKTPMPMVTIQFEHVHTSEFAILYSKKLWRWKTLVNYSNSPSFFSNFHKFEGFLVCFYLHLSLGIYVWCHMYDLLLMAITSPYSYTAQLHAYSVYCHYTNG